MTETSKRHKDQWRQWMFIVLENLYNEYLKRAFNHWLECLNLYNSSLYEVICWNFIVFYVRVFFKSSCFPKIIDFEENQEDIIWREKNTHNS